MPGTRSVRRNRRDLRLLRSRLRLRTRSRWTRLRRSLLLRLGFLCLGLAHSACSLHRRSYRGRSEAVKPGARVQRTPLPPVGGVGALSLETRHVHQQRRNQLSLSLSFAHLLLPKARFLLGFTGLFPGSSLVCLSPFLVVFEFVMERASDHCIRCHLVVFALSLSERAIAQNIYDGDPFTSCSSPGVGDTRASPPE